MGNDTHDERTIACLGWGSLIWNPELLPIRGTWQTDGPMVKVEFVRQSMDSRMTLVLHEEATPVRALWILMDCANKTAAKQELYKREFRKRKIDDMRKVNKNIGAWKKGENGSAGFPDTILDLEKWASSRGIDAVVWTNLKHQFNGKKDRIPTVDEVIYHLSCLDKAARKLAEEYVRKTPPQIDTMYRRKIERCLGWYPTKSIE
ncbi:MAG: hypothetical protein OXI46_11420 [Gemmatimonadota bacterium]|nr:hypothetical protein [Gemmatimonadota bacterium]